MVTALGRGRNIEKNHTIIVTPQGRENLTERTSKKGSWQPESKSLHLPSLLSTKGKKFAATRVKTWVGGVGAEGKGKFREKGRKLNTKNEGGL